MRRAVRLRDAVAGDIPHMHVIRMRVRENVLSNPLIVQEKDYSPLITAPNKGWVAVLDERIIGFAIIDVQRFNVWALFVDPDHEGIGAGRLLNDELTGWFFRNHRAQLWLTTAPGTKAERFYERNGWMKTGTQPNGELRFELQPDN